MTVNIYTSAKIPHAGGMSTHILGVVSQLKSDGIPCNLYSANGDATPSSGGAKSYPPSIYFLYVIFKILRCFVTYKASEGRLNIFHDWFSMIGTRKYPGARSILYVHGELVNELSALGTLKGQSFWVGVFRWLEGWALRKADIVVCVDERLQSYVRSAHNIEAISKPNFVTLPIEVREPSAPRNIVRIVISRRFVEKNGVFYGLEALKLLHDRLGNDFNLEVNVFGGGQLYESLRSKFDYPYINFHGDVTPETVRFFLRTSHFCLVPSIPVDGYIEATSISALEALAEGTLLVASNIGGLKQLFQGNHTAALVPPGNAEAISQTLEYFIRNSEQYMQMAKTGQQYVLENFSSPAYVHDFLLKL